MTKKSDKEALAQLKQARKDFDNVAIVGWNDGEEPPITTPIPQSWESTGETPKWQQEGFAGEKDG